ncbi:hypothetical protein EDD17DRAFT_616705 [Pisolithus thermaeus]|nr:hypothetical protein EDD17DRAFT_616705 [Pisolithus thermaeus]
MLRGTSSYLTQLPVELICHVLSYLTANELTRARQICKTIKAVVDHSEQLQYIIDLGFFRVLEIPSNQYRGPVAARRKELGEFEASWRNVKYRRRCDFRLLTSGFVYEFVGGIYALAGEGYLHFSVLPHNPREDSQPIRTWCHPVDMTALVDFTFCPAQDLLVIVNLAATDHRHCYDLHLQSLSTNKPHPSAASAILKAVNERKHAFYHTTGPVKIQILDKYMAILCRNVVVDDNEMTDYFQLWAWKTDKDSKFVMRFTESMTDFIFLAEDRFLLLADDGTITIFSFASDQTLVGPRCTAKLVMPTLMQDWHFADASLGGNPAPAIGIMTSLPRHWAENGDSSMFHPTADDQLLAFHVTIYRMTNENDMHSFVFFVFRSELLRLQSLYEKEYGKQEGLQRPSLPYSIWGRSRAHWFPDHCMDWQNSVYGYRTVELLNESQILFSTEPRRLRVRDFNPSLPYSIPRACNGTAEESRHLRQPEHRRCQLEPGKGYSVYCIGISAEAERSCIRPFAEPLGNGLPHREIVTEETFNATEVMMDEGRILLFSRDNSKEVLNLEVLVM